MTNRMTCIECPVGCVLSVTAENGKFIKVEGNKCPKGETYAIAETENPVRVLTSTVLTRGMDIRMVPVRTDRPIPKGSIFRAMEEIRKARITKALRVGDIVIPDIAGSGADLIATRETFPAPKPDPSLG